MYCVGNLGIVKSVTVSKRTEKTQDEPKMTATMKVKMDKALKALQNGDTTAMKVLDDPEFKKAKDNAPFKVHTYKSTSSTELISFELR